MDVIQLPPEGSVAGPWASFLLSRVEDAGVRLGLRDAFERWAAREGDVVALVRLRWAMIRRGLLDAPGPRDSAPDPPNGTPRSTR